jgi:hypothetical protein
MEPLTATKLLAFGCQPVSVAKLPSNGKNRLLARAARKTLR